MRKFVLAGMAAVFMLAMGNTALAGHCASGLEAGRFYGGCHGRTDTLRQNWVRHDCIYADEDCDLICDSCGWHYERHHALDGEGHCLTGACSYDNCGYGQGTGYCRGYCNSLDVQAPGNGLSQSDSAQTVPVSETNDAVPVNATSWNSNTGGASSPANGNAGNDAAVNAAPGYAGGGCHGSGHHGGGHHGRGRY